MFPMIAIRIVGLLFPSLLATFFCSEAFAQFYAGQIGRPVALGNFRNVTRVTSDAAGNVYILDQISKIITKYDVNGVPQISWGGEGTGDNQFVAPTEITTDQMGNVYVVDGNNQYKKYDSNSGFIEKKIITGLIDGTLRGIASNGNLVYITDNSGIHRFSSTSYIGKFGFFGSGEGQFKFPSGIAFDASGNIYVVEQQNNRVQVLNSSFNFVKQWAVNTTSQSTLRWGLALDGNGNVYIADPFNHQVAKYPATFPQSGVANYWGGFGITDGKFNTPLDITVDGLGTIYVADVNNNRIQKFNSSGAFLSKMLSGPPGDGQFNSPYGITTDQSRNVYVTDFDLDRVQKFDSEGNFVAKWGLVGSSDGQFIDPSGIAVDGNQDIYVVDQTNRIQIFSSSGVFKKKWNMPSGTSRGSIAIDQNNNVFVADPIQSQVTKYNSSGVLQKSWGSSGSANGQFLAPNGIAIDGIGNVYVADLNNNRIQKFDNSGTFIEALGTFGNNDGQFRLAFDIAFDQADNMFVTDNYIDRIQKFKNFSTFKLNWGSTGTGNSQFRSPAGIDIDNMGNIYVVDMNNFRVQRFINLSIFSLPASGDAGTTITINGVGFGPVAAENKVKFNGVQATVVSASDAGTSLTVIIPPGATTGTVSVQYKTFSAESTNEFLITPLRINSFEPKTASIGQSITIKGLGFSSVAAGNIVKFNGATGVVTNSSPTSISTRVPIGATTGKITVTIAGVTGESSTDFNLTTLVFTNPNYPTYYTVGESSVIAFINVNSIAEVQSVKFYSRGISSKDPAFKIDAVTLPATALVSFTIPSSYFTDPIGLHYYFGLIDKNGNEASPTDDGYTYLNYPATSSKQVIPNLIFGKTVDRYQLVSIPLKLTSSDVSSVFSALGADNNTKWRLYSYNGYSNTEMDNRATIVLGSAYWLIVRDPIEINPGAGTTAIANEKSPYVITLKPGWNLIGNPYNFSILWQDVLDYNGKPATVGNLRHFNVGEFTDTDVLGRSKGAFVRLDGLSTFDLKIPVTNKQLAGGRINRSAKANSIDSKDWQVDLVVEDGRMRNMLGGFGMNLQAKDELDHWDEVYLPLPLGAATFDIAMKELKDAILIKDIVTTSEAHTWNGKISSLSGVTLSWDNSAFGDNEKKLILETDERVNIVDMRNINHTTLPPGTQNFKIHYGDEAYIKANTVTPDTRVSEVFPNPANRFSKTLSVYISLPAGVNVVKMDLRDITGATPLISAEGKYNEGRRVVEWNTDLTSLSAGLYIMRISTQNHAGPKTFYRKVLID